MGALLDAVPAGGADHTEHHRDLATAVEAAGGGGDAPLVVTINAADILSCWSVYPTVIAAPGALKFLAIEHVTAELITGTTGYTLAGDVWLGFGATPVFQLGSFLPNSPAAIISGPALVNTGYRAGLENAPLQLVAAAGEPTGGDWDLLLTIKYHEVDLYD